MSEKIILEFKNEYEFLQWFSFSQYEETLYEIYYKRLENNYAKSEDKQSFSEELKYKIMSMSKYPCRSTSPGAHICEQMELKASANFYEKIRCC